MKIKILLNVFILVIGAVASAYIYSLIDPRLEIIMLKNEEIMRLDNKIAELTEINSKLDEQVNSIASVVKTNENKSGRINDEYRVCVRTSRKLKTKNKRLSTELKVEKNKNKILQDYVQVKNEVTSLEEQTKALQAKKKQLTEGLGANANQNLDVEGAAVPVESHESHPATVQ